MYDELTEVDIQKMQEEIDHRVRVLRAINMPRGRPRARAMAREMRPSRRETGIFSATMVLMDTPLR